MTQIDNSHQNSQNGFLFGWLLILIGVSLLLINLGYLSPNFLSELIKYWPLILILLGIDLLVDQQWLMNLVYLGLGLTFLFYIFNLAFNWIEIDQYCPFKKQRQKVISRLYRSDQYQTKKLQVDKKLDEDITKREINIKTGVSQLDVTDGEWDNDLLKAEVRYYSGLGEPKLIQNITDNRIVIDYSSPPARAQFLPKVRGLNQRTVEKIKIGQPGLKTDLNLEIGLGTTTLNFNQLNLKQLQAEVGLGSCDIMLAEGSIPTEARLKVGMGTIKLVIPRSVGLKIEHQVGLGRVELNGSSLKGNDIYQSDNFDQAEQQLLITTEVGAGSVQVVRQ
jgi:predicted membrane protein